MPLCHLCSIFGFDVELHSARRTAATLLKVTERDVRTILGVILLNLITTVMYSFMYHGGQVLAIKGTLAKLLERDGILFQQITLPLMT